MDFRLSDEHERLRQRCLELAADFAARSPEHDREATHPTENYERLREEEDAAESSRDNGHAKSLRR